MRVLLVTGGFAGPGRQPWLLDDLADALVQAGHEVDVIVGDPMIPRPRGAHSTASPRMTVFSVGRTRPARWPLAKLAGYLGVGFRLHTQGFAWAKRHHYDLCLYTSPASFSWMFPGRLLRAGIASHTLLFLWDFFPIHQLEIGRIRLTWFARLMKAIERKAIDGASTVALMSPANFRFYKRYHPGTESRTVEIPPWSSSKALDSIAPANPPLRVIFGGQLAKGRGVDTLLEAAALLTDREKDFEFWIAGDGPERRNLQKEAQRRSIRNIQFYGSVPREDYRSLAQSAHVGIAITVPGISPPSFPSKIVEYCSLALPVIVCVENASDAGEFIASRSAGFASPAGDARKLAETLERAYDLLKSGGLRDMASAARNLFETRLSVESAVATLENVLACAEPSGAVSSRTHGKYHA